LIAPRGVRRGGCDFRVPSLDWLGGRLSNPHGPLFPASLFGVGWTLNVGRLARIVGLA